MDQKKAEELIRRLAGALRGTELYSPAHPVVQRGIDVFTSAATEALHTSPSIVIGFIGDEIVVDGHRLSRGTAALVGLVTADNRGLVNSITAASAAIGTRTDR